MKNIKLIKTLKEFKVNSSNTRPILQNVKILNNTLYFTDLETMLIIKKIDIEFNIFTDYEECHIIDKNQFVKFLEKKDQITISKQGTLSILTSHKTSLKLPCYNEGDYPEALNTENLTNENCFIIGDNSNITKAIIQASIFSNKEKNRYALNSVKLDLSNNFAVATDQVVLRMSSFHSISKAIDTIETNNNIIPLNMVNLLKHIQLNRIYANKENTIFKGYNFEIITRNIDANYVNYIGAFDNFKNSETLETTLKDMKNCIDDLSLVSCEQCRNFSFNGKNMKITTPIGDMETSLENYCTIDFQVGLNIDNIKNYLKLKQSNFKIYLTAPKKPIVFQDNEGLFFMSPTSL